MNAEHVKPVVLKRSRTKSGSEFQPIVLDYKPRKKKRNKAEDSTGNEPRYSRNLKDVQKLEGDVVRIARRASTTVTKGLDTYDKERKKSAMSKKDGAIEDFPHNATKAVSESLKEASELPVDLADALLTKNYRRQIRRSLRRASRALKLFRF